MDAKAKWAEVRAMDAPGEYRLGPNTYDRYVGDPRRIGFMLARYAAAAKLLKDCDNIVEIGCGDAFGTATFWACTSASTVVGVDFDKALIDHAQANHRTSGKALFRHADFMTDEGLADVGFYYDGLCSLDVIEHIEPARSVEFLQRCSEIMSGDGIAVIGTPNKLASKYASGHSKAGHINLLSPDKLERQMKKVFDRVIILSMNDSVVHLGFPNMAHYLIGLGFR